MAINTELVRLMLQAVNPLFVIYRRSLNWDAIFMSGIPYQWNFMNCKIPKS